MAHWVWIAVGALIGGVVNAGAQAIADVATGREIDLSAVGVAFVSGA